MTAQSDKEKSTVILGTAGHIDHGKTTLVKALTGTDCDRLKEEKARGITIELGFASLELPSGRMVGVVDVPGHERFVKNMVAGAVGMDLVALVIAADEGVMPQTREHMEICQLLGVRKGLIVLTKSDMVDEEWLELVQDDVREFVQNTFLEEAPMVPVSSTTGQGLDELLKIMDALVVDIEPRAPVGPYRLPVDRVFSIKGFGTVVTGTTLSGQVSLGQDVMIYPRGLEARVRGIQTHGADSTEAHPGMRTALNLQGLGTSDIRRGDCVATSGSLRASYLIDLEFFYLSSAEKPLKYRAPIRFHAGTAEIMGRVLMAGDEIEPGKTSYIQVQLEEPVAVLPGDHYVIRSYSPIRTIGGGRILNPLPRKRKRTKPEMWEELKLLARGEPHELVELHIRKAGLRGLTPVEISIRSGMYGKALVKLMDRLSGSKKIIRLEGEDRIIHISVFEELCLNAVRFLENYHKDNPLVSGVSKEEFRSRIFPAALQARAATQTATQKIFNRLLTHLVKEGKIIQEQDEVRLSTHKVALGEREAEIRTTIEEIYRKAGLATPSREEALKKAAHPDEMEAAGEIFDLLVRDGALVRLKDKLFYHPSALEDIRNRVLKFFEKNEELGIDDFRKLSGGVSRKYMIPLLEYLDSQRITLRVGEKRKLRGGK